MIKEKYLLAVDQQIPFYMDPAGRRFVNQLWHKDLLMHLTYLGDLVIASPCIRGAIPADAVLIDGDPRFSSLSYVDLPNTQSLGEMIGSLPSLVRTLFKAIRQADIIHTTIAGWPFPMGWLAVPLSILSQKYLVIVVESAPWRIREKASQSWKARIRSVFQEYIGSCCVRRADIAVFTQDEYRKSLLLDKWTDGHVIPASWIDDSIVITDDQADDLWESRLAIQPPRLRVLFVGRLVRDKGVLVLLEAMRLLASENKQITLGILGEGTLLGECREAAELCQGPTKIEVLDSVPYGPAFFKLLSTFDTVVVPCISDEQPRIVFDAYSQALPVLATDTPGLRSCIEQGRTGLFAKANDAPALAGLMSKALHSKRSLQSLGMQALTQARLMTHKRIHRSRYELLQRMLGD